MSSASVAREINSVTHKVHTEILLKPQEGNHRDTEGFLISTANHPSEELYHSTFPPAAHERFRPILAGTMCNPFKLFIVNLIGKKRLSRQFLFV